MYIELLFADFLLIPAFEDGGGRHFAVLEDNN